MNGLFKRYDTVIGSVATLLVISLLVGCTPPSDESQPGEGAPITPQPSEPVVLNDLSKSFSVPSLQAGRDFIRSSEFVGNIVLVEFWVTWSEPCRESAKNLETLYQDFRRKDFVVLGMAMDQGAKSSIQNNLDRLGITYPVGLASERVGRDFGGVKVMPTKFVFDRNGVLAKTYTGFVHIDELHRDIETLLAKDKR